MLLTRLMFPFLAAAAAVAQTAVVATIPADPGNFAIPHDAISGRAVTLKGVSTLSGPKVEAIWDFGDGSEPYRTAVADGADLSVRHTYVGAAGALFTARLTVIDGGERLSSSAEYLVWIKEPSAGAEARIALEDGLWYLYRTMNRSGKTGSWQGACEACDAKGSTTASNVLAFEAAGFLASGKSPYSAAVARGLAFLLANMDDPAVHTADWAEAIEAAKEPDRVSEVGPLAGLAYHGIVSISRPAEHGPGAAEVTSGGIRQIAAAQQPGGYWTGKLATAGAAIRLAHAITTSGLQTTNVTSSVGVNTSGFLLSRVTHTYNGTLTVHNTSGNTIAGPITAVLTNLVSGVTLANGGGFYGGNPYIAVTANSLTSGQSASVALQFNNSGNVLITATVVVYAGSFPPATLSVACPASTYTQGTSYSSSLVGSGGVVPYTYSIQSGSLPDNVNLTPSTGALSGTPNANESSTWHFTPGVTDSSSPSILATNACTITTTPACTPAGASCNLDNPGACCSQACAQPRPGITYCCTFSPGPYQCPL